MDHQVPNKCAYDIVEVLRVSFEYVYAICVHI